MCRLLGSLAFHGCILRSPRDLIPIALKRSDQAFAGACRIINIIFLDRWIDTTKGAGPYVSSSTSPVAMASKLQHCQRAPPLLLLKLLVSSCVNHGPHLSYQPLSAFCLSALPIVQSLCDRVQSDGNRHRIFHGLQASHEGILEICCLHISCSFTSSDPLLG